jgi:CHAT domain-containing protein/Flp pilus assembly protein TadD
MPEGQPLALDRSGLATALTLKGDYGEASLQLRRALSVLERAAPSSAEHAHALFTAGRLARITGDLAGAERDYRRSLQIYEKLFPNGLAVGTGLRALSIVAWDRRDFAAAESRAKQALAIEERLTPGTPRVSELVHHLGDIALDSGDAAGAEPYFRRALALNEARAPEGREAASDLRCLSLALARSGRLDEAETQARRSLELRRRQAPSSIHMSRSLVALGEIAMLQGRALDSEGFYQQALAITTRLIPASREEAQAHYGLGRALRRAGRRVEAAEALARATAALERAQARVGGGAEAQGGFSAAYSRYYQEEIEVLMELGRPDDAFAVIERSRARSRLALLGARAGAFMADLPTAVARARQQNQAAYDRAQAELTALDPETQQAEIERGLARLRELRDENAEILAQVRVASPRLAALHAPKPLDVTEARASLDPGDALLSFAVGEAETFVFVLTPESEEHDRRLTVFKVPLSEEKLRRTVESFRRSIERGDALDLVRAQAAALYDRLLRPVDAMLVRCRRAAVSADGPLHLLPFAALLRTEPHGRLESGRWLAQWLPTHSVGSATQYAELKKARRAITPAEMKLVAFGDPRSTAVPPLPHSRHEVEAIVAAFGKQVVAYLGEEATEARVKDGLQAFSHLHFACHGVLDERYPLHSALVLSAPADLVEGQENGMLQVWEILDGVRLDADLVTLSGCNTALGREMGGEGLLGLTRAFQYAGARSVLASLWAVGDESTAELMRRFYGHVKAGKDKADALRAAQIELISGALTETTGDETSRGVGARVQVSGRDGAHPFRWASFQLVGDWR